MKSTISALSSPCTYPGRCPYTAYAYDKRRGDYVKGCVLSAVNASRCPYAFGRDNYKQYSTREKEQVRTNLIKRLTT